MENSQYPVLKSHFALRQVGSDLIYLMNSRTGEFFELEPAQFEALRLSDGLRSIDEISKEVAVTIGDVKGFFEEQRDESVVDLGTKLAAPITPHYRRSELPHMSDVLVEVTGECNLRCKHCFNSSYNEPSAISSEMNTEQLLKLISELDDMNVRRIQLSGGEAILRKDLWKIIRALEDHRIFLDVISTNALLVDEKSAVEFGSKFKNHGALYISIDGISPYTYETLRGHGTFEQLNRSIDLLSKEGCLMFINTMAFKQNLNELEKMYDWMLARPTIKGWRIGMPKVLGRYEEHHHDLEVEFGEVIKIFTKILKRWLKERPPLRLELSDFFRTDALDIGLDTHNPTDNPCKYAMTNASIKPDGTVVFCASLQVFPEAILGNAIKDGLPAVWYGQKHREFRNLTLRDLPQCKCCRYSKLCGGGCRSNALLSFGDIRAADPRACIAMKTLEDEILECLDEEHRKMFSDLINKDIVFSLPTGYRKYI